MRAVAFSERPAAILGGPKDLVETEGAYLGNNEILRPP
jgi:hypothetical protein